MYYINIDPEDTNRLTYKCRKCGHVDGILGKEQVCVMHTQLKRGENQYKYMVSEYTKLDPTLPRIFMPCPNETCSRVVKTNKSQEAATSEVLYIRYDDENLKYLYMCTTCDSVWISDDTVRRV